VSEGLMSNLHTIGHLATHNVVNIARTLVIVYVILMGKI